jgi:hypothetical protein
MKITSNIDEIIKSINKEKTAIEQGTKIAIHDLTQKAYEEVIDKCIKANLGNYIGSVKVKYPEANNGVGEVSTDDMVIIFNEYGTGIVGKGNPHPAIDGWEYDINNHGEAGWVYPKKDGTYGRTRGIRSKKMFYETSEDMKKEAVNSILVEIKRLEK